MPSQPAPWAVYRDVLVPLKFGDALWEPGPIYSYTRVRLGDVGYIRRGRFHLLFSAGIPLGSRVLGTDVPLTFEPLDVGPIISGEVRPPGYLRSKTVRQIGADVSGSVAVAYTVEPGARIAFELTSKQGAALITKYPTHREDIERDRRFVKYIKQYYKSWDDFAREQDHPEDVRPILVTGVDLTREFATVAYSDNNTSMECEFSATLPTVASTSVSVWGSWRTPGLVHANCGPDPARQRRGLGGRPAPESEIPDEHTQCVFIRYYTIRKRAFFPVVLKAGAGPHQLPKGDHRDDDSGEERFQVLSIDDPIEIDPPESRSPSVTSDEAIHNVPTDDRDMFDIVADFIFQKSDAKSMLLHHDDVQDFLQGNEEELSRSLAESRIAERVEVDENGIGQLSPAVTGSSKFNPSGSKIDTELNVNNHTMADIRRDVLDRMEADSLYRMEANSLYHKVRDSTSGESPPPPPSIFFGREEQIEEIVYFAERLMPVALIGAGGIGKTSIVLTALHDDRIKRKFGDNRRFVRCDNFTPSLPYFLHQLSQAVGATIKNPSDLKDLRRFLFSREILIVIDNAESILDPQMVNAKEIYAVMEELSQMRNVCLCLTSRISTFLPSFECVGVPTLSNEAACDTFYRIYKCGQRSDRIDNILEQLDFHALSITLLATVAQRNGWDAPRLAEEWYRRWTDILQTDHSKSLATTIELSLSSPTFQKLGPYARDLLKIIAFFPQGVDRNKIDKLFPTIAGNIFDEFCVLSLAQHRADGFITMLAPVREYLSPKNPMSIPLLCSARDHYFTLLMAHIEPQEPGFKETRWIVSEDVNVEYLLDVFTSIDAPSRGVWDACAGFMKHLYWHKPRPVTLGWKLEALTEDHPSKPQYLYELSRLYQAVGNYAECKRLLTLVVELFRRRGDDHQLTRALIHLSHVHSNSGSREEAIRPAEEASEISERLGDVAGQAQALAQLGWLFWSGDQLDRAEEAASHAIDLLSEKDDQFLVCDCHRLLGRIYRSKHHTEKAVHHFETALQIASPFKWPNLLFCIHFDLSELFFDQARFNEANTHIEHATQHAAGHREFSSRARVQQALFQRMQRGFERARSVRTADEDVRPGNPSYRSTLVPVQKRVPKSSNGESGR